MSNWTETTAFLERQLVGDVVCVGSGVADTMGVGTGLGTGLGTGALGVVDAAKREADQERVNIAR